jgi:hypothetical protein
MRRKADKNPFLVNAAELIISRAVGFDQILVESTVFFIKADKYNMLNFGSFWQGVTNNTDSYASRFEPRIAVNTRTYTWKSYAFKSGF